MDFEAIKQLIQHELEQTDQLIHQRLKSEVELINSLAEHIIDSGGKRIRPVLVLLIAKATGQCQQKHHLTAAIIELIHTATLLHDDVIDTSSLRRGKPTANSIWGNTASVLTGDYLFSRAFEMMVEIQSLKALNILATASNEIATGELMQLSNAHNPELSIKAYLETIEYKTAKLFEAACEVPAVINQASPKVQHACKRFGTLLGMAFQITDDIIDYTSTSKEMGKNIGDDLSDGKMTLPLIYALETTTFENQAIIRAAVTEGDDSKIEIIRAIILSTDAIDRCKATAEEITHEAMATLDAFAESAVKEGLLALCKLVTKRLS